MNLNHPRALSLTAVLLLSNGGCGSDGNSRFQGYVEGEYLYLSAAQAGYLQSLDAPRGSKVEAGTTVFSISGEPDNQLLNEAQARADSARQKLENLKLPKRNSEIAALEANLHAAQAAARLAKLQLERQQQLLAKRFVSQAAVDEARSAFDRAGADVESLQKQIATFRNSLGRQAEIAAAESDLAAADAQIEQKRWLLTHKTVTAPAVGEISDTYYLPGEWIAAGAPVASLLPDRRRRLRFYVPEQQLATIKLGATVQAICDSCPAPIRGQIDFIAPQAEYTPPVIYSRGSREKLVFRVEAAPAADQAALIHPGLPIEVELASP